MSGTYIRNEYTYKILKLVGKAGLVYDNDEDIYLDIAYCLEQEFIL